MHELEVGVVHLAGTSQSSEFGHHFGESRLDVRDQRLVDGWPLRLQWCHRMRASREGIGTIPVENVEDRREHDGLLDRRIANCPKIASRQKNLAERSLLKVLADLPVQAKVSVFTGREHIER